MTAILRAKATNRFRVHFDNFGNNEPQLASQVIRVTRPGVAFCEVFGTPEAEHKPITLDLRDDALDQTRSTVIAQVARQHAHKATFAMVIETLDGGKVLEQWRLTQCRIVDCHLDELDSTRSDGLAIRLVIAPGNVSVALGGEMIEFVADIADRDG